MKCISLGLCEIQNTILCLLLFAFRINISRPHLRNRYWCIWSYLIFREYFFRPLFCLIWITEFRFDCFDFYLPTNNRPKWMLKIAKKVITKLIWQTPQSVWKRCQKKSRRLANMQILKFKCLSSGILVYVNHNKANK